MFLVLSLFSTQRPPEFRGGSETFSRLNSFSSQVYASFLAGGGCPSPLGFVFSWWAESFPPLLQLSPPLFSSRAMRDDIRTLFVAPFFFWTGQRSPFFLIEKAGEDILLMLQGEFSDSGSQSPFCEEEGFLIFGRRCGRRPSFFI